MFETKILLLEVVEALTSILLVMVLQTEDE